MSNGKRRSVEEMEETATEPIAEARMESLVPTVPEPRKLEDPPVELDVFVSVTGKRPDQVRGFALWSRKQNLGRRSVPEWETEWRRYLERPV